MTRGQLPVGVLLLLLLLLGVFGSASASFLSVRAIAGGEETITRKPEVAIFERGEAAMQVAFNEASGASLLPEGFDSVAGLTCLVYGNGRNDLFLSFQGTGDFEGVLAVQIFSSPAQEDSLSLSSPERSRYFLLPGSYAISSSSRLFYDSVTGGLLITAFSSRDLDSAVFWISSGEGLTAAEAEAALADGSLEDAQALVVGIPSGSATSVVGWAHDVTSRILYYAQQDDGNDFVNALALDTSSCLDGECDSVEFIAAELGHEGMPHHEYGDMLIAFDATFEDGLFCLLFEDTTVEKAFFYVVDIRELMQGTGATAELQALRLPSCTQPPAVVSEAEHSFYYACNSVVVTCDFEQLGLTSVDLTLTQLESPGFLGVTSFLPVVDEPQSVPTRTNLLLYLTQADLEIQLTWVLDRAAPDVISPGAKLEVFDVGTSLQAAISSCTARHNGNWLFYTVAEHDPTVMVYEANNDLSTGLFDVAQFEYSFEDTRFVGTFWFIEFLVVVAQRSSEEGGTLEVLYFWPAGDGSVGSNYSSLLTTTPQLGLETAIEVHFDSTNNVVYILWHGDDGYGVQAIALAGVSMGQVDTFVSQIFPPLTVSDGQWLIRGMGTRRDTSALVLCFVDYNSGELWLFNVPDSYFQSGAASTAENPLPGSVVQISTDLMASGAWQPVVVVVDDTVLVHFAGGLFAYSVLEGTMVQSLSSSSQSTCAAVVQVTPYPTPSASSAPSPSATKTVSMTSTRTPSASQTGARTSTPSASPSISPSPEPDSLTDVHESTLSPSSDSPREESSDEGGNTAMIVVGSVLVAGSVVMWVVVCCVAAVLGVFLWRRVRPYVKQTQFITDENAPAFEADMDRFQIEDEEDEDASF